MEYLKNPKILGAVFFVIIVLILLIISMKSSFTAQSYLNYNDTGCKRENRYYPMGNLPGSQIGLTQAEQQGLLKNFILDNKNVT